MSQTTAEIDARLSRAIEVIRYVQGELDKALALASSTGRMELTSIVREQANAVRKHEGRLAMARQRLS